MAHWIVTRKQDVRNCGSPLEAVRIACSQPCDSFIVANVDTGQSYTVESNVVTPVTNVIPMFSIPKPDPDGDNDTPLQA